MVTEGKKVPNIKLMDSDGELVELSKLKGSIVVVYFYPKDDTSGCTKEALDFTSLISEFKDAGAIVLGISPTARKATKSSQKNTTSS